MLLADKLLAKYNKSKRKISNIEKIPLSPLYWIQANRQAMQKFSYSLQKVRRPNFNKFHSLVIFCLRNKSLNSLKLMVHRLLLFS